MTQAITIPDGSHRVSFTVLVLAGKATVTGGTLAVRAIVYLKQDRRTGQSYRFANK